MHVSLSRRFIVESVTAFRHQSAYESHLENGRFFILLLLVERYLELRVRELIGYVVVGLS